MYSRGIDTLLGVASFIERLVERVAAGRSQVLMVPDAVNIGSVESLITAQIFAEDLDAVTVSLGNSGDGKTCTDALLEQASLNIKVDSDPVTVGRLVSEVAGRCEVIIIEWEGTTDTVRNQELVRIINSWERAGRSVGDQGAKPTALVVALDARPFRDMIPSSGPFMDITWWWGVPTTLDARISCRLRSTDDPGAVPALWREHVIPALVAWDIELIDYVWADITGGYERIFSSLETYASDRGWSGDSINDDLPDVLSTVSDQGTAVGLRPPSQLIGPWLAGQVNWTPEFGIEFHPSLLAASGRRLQIEHRIWRGQAELILPIIDQIRRAFCDHMAAQYREDWVTRWQVPDSIEEQKMADENGYLTAQWGHIVTLLQTTAEISRQRSRWLPTARKARWIRNQIAHYKPVEFSEFQSLMRLWEQAS